MVWDSGTAPSLPPKISVLTVSLSLRYVGDGEDLSVSEIAVMGVARSCLGSVHCRRVSSLQEPLVGEGHLTVVVCVCVSSLR